MMWPARKESAPTTWVARATARFERAGEYPIFCHEYCGIAHHVMWGKVIVETSP